VTSRRCDKCDFNWPPIFEYHVCPNCDASTGYSSADPSFGQEEAGIIARRLRFDRECDLAHAEHEVEQFRSEMERGLGPSVLH